MFRVLIVDDEPIIGKGIQAILSNYPKYQVVGIAKNGHEALEFVQQNETDIVLTDIEMPQMNGIELTEGIRKLKKGCQIIFITAFRDFKYAQAAINLKVDNYLVKPIVEENLIAALEKAEFALNKNQKLNHFILKEQLQQFFYGRKLPRLNHVDLGDQAQNFCMIYIQQQKIDAVPPKKIWDKNFRVFKHAISFEEGTSSIYYLLEGCYSMDWEAEIFYLKQFYPDHLFIASENFNHLSEIYFILGGIQRERDRLFFGTPPPAMITESLGINALLPILEQSYDYRFFLDHFHALIDSTALASDFQLLLFYSNIAQIHTQILTELTQKLTKLDLTKEKITLLIKQWEIALTFQEYKRTVLEQFDEWFMAYGDHAAQAIPEDIFILKEYIKKNFYRDISLEELASLVHKNKSYVSTYFKKHTGTSFKVFQTDLRMTEAKHLLLTTDQRVYEIADKVGYVGTHHFNKVFVNYFGKNPTQYRDNL